MLELQQFIVQYGLNVSGRYTGFAFENEVHHFVSPRGYNCFGMSATVQNQHNTTRLRST
jgi:hypothetical protein